MKRFTANYANTNHNFVIQNLTNSAAADKVYYPALCIIGNILQRGCPSRPSKFLNSQFEGIDLSSRTPLISCAKLNWERIIRGDVKNNYNPAQKFFDVLLPKYFADLPFLSQLIVPEVPINEITHVDVLEFSQQQVDFYVPLAFLVIEIDGLQHDSQSDRKRDTHLQKYGIKTIRISTAEVNSESPAFLSKIQLIRQRLNQVNELQSEKKSNGFDLISFDDYKNAARGECPLQVLPTAVIRFQILIIEALKCNRLSFDENWEITVYSHESVSYESVAIEDLFNWFENLFALQRIKFKRPKTSVRRVASQAELYDAKKSLKIDFSVLDHYTDEFQNHEDTVYVRTDYFEHFRYYKNTDAAAPAYVDLEAVDYFKVSSTTPIKYKIKIGDEWKPEKTLQFFLENIFGYEIFYPGQLPIIISALSGNDTIGLLPTGGGKSICYQLATLLQPALSFVVCPIKSLMYDQKQDLDSIGISRVHHITSDDDGADKEKTMQQFVAGKYLFILISPERFQIRAFRDHLLAAGQRHCIGYAVIDEVHCLSEWGHDFRTSYLNLSKTVRKHCNGFNFLGLTATASINVLKDIQLEFQIRPENVKTLVDYTRPELDFHVISDNNSKAQSIKDLLSEVHDDLNIVAHDNRYDKCGIIFTPTVNGPKGCYNLSTDLERELRMPVKYYSGTVPKSNKAPIMDSSRFEDYKQRVQREFKNNEYSLLVATKAFGMGVNKGNVYYTIHYGIPGSIESLYQEAGRAGRAKTLFSKTQANCFVLFTKTTNYDTLQKIWSRETSFSQFKELIKQVDGDISTNMFLFEKSLDLIRDEFDLISRLISIYGTPGVNKIKVSARQLNSEKSKTEKAIYRLSQLGIIEDWVILNFFSGEFEVEFGDFNESSVVAKLEETIRKYDPEFAISKLANNKLYSKYDEIWKRDQPILNKAIVILLQWAYDHFASNRRQSQKNVYEVCDDLSTGKITNKEFKSRVEDYFKFSEVTYLLQDIAENPSDFSKWFLVFYSDQETRTTKNIINVDKQHSLLAALSRFLESYENNVGLDLISGILRLLVDDFHNADGKERFVSAFTRILSFRESDVARIFDQILGVGTAMSSSSKNLLAETLIDFYPDNKEVMIKIQNRLNDDFTTDLRLHDFINRIKQVNTKIYGGLKQIR